LFAIGSKNISSSDIQYLEDGFVYIENSVNYFDENVVFLEESLRLLDSSIKVAHVYEYGTEEYEKSLSLFSVAYPNLKKLANTAKIACVVVLLVQTGGTTGVLIPMFCVPTTKAAIKQMALQGTQLFANSAAVATIFAAVPTGINYAKTGKVDSGTFISYAKEGFFWVSFLQECNLYRRAVSAIKITNTPDEPFLESDRTVINAKYADKTYKHFSNEGGKTSFSYKVASKIGIKFSDEGYPNFKPFAKAVYTHDSPLPPSRNEAFALADKSININAAYRSKNHLTWHHSEDGRSLYLVSSDIHNANVGGVAHSGGQSLLNQYYDLLSQVN
jgi:hypothetical protein